MLYAHDFATARAAGKEDPTLGHMCTERTSTVVQWSLSCGGGQYSEVLSCVAPPSALRVLLWLCPKYSRPSEPTDDATPDVLHEDLHDWMSALALEDASISWPGNALQMTISGGLSTNPLEPWKRAKWRWTARSMSLKFRHTD
eukprot:76411-Prymnesium_polylepis.3